MRRVPEIIRKKRRELDIKQDQIAEALGMSQPAYSLIESGETTITLIHIIKIAKVLDVNPHKLLPKDITLAVSGQNSLLGHLIFLFKKWWYGRKIKRLR
ncbi:Helix-turn-helix [bacterium A37T11]|nr:Helix-turn-helix [bacterium A37T11]